MEVAEPQTGVPDGWEVVTPGAATPMGSERTRVDTTAVGVDHEKLLQGIADWASKLPPRWQKPAAILATFPADVLGSLVEMISSPEVIATGASPRAAAQAVKDAPGAMSEQVVAAAKAAVPSKQTVGTVMEGTGRLMQHPLRFSGKVLERAGTALKQSAAAELSDVELARQELAAGRITPEVLAGVEKAAAAESAASGMTAPAAVVKGNFGDKLLTLHKAKMKLTAEEMKVAQEMLRRGIEPQAILDNIEASRAFKARFNVPTPTAAQTRFPKGQRGGRPKP